MKRLKIIQLFSILLIINACSKGISTGPEGISEENLKTQWEEKQIELDAHMPIPDDEVFHVVEQAPKIKGGLEQLSYLTKYPDEARANNIEGRVFVQFVVDATGKVRNPKALKGIGFGCDEAALLAVSKLEFEPGVQRGKNVAVRFTLPVVFKLNEEK